MSKVDYSESLCWASIATAICVFIITVGGCAVERDRLQHEERILQMKIELHLKDKEGTPCPISSN